MLRDVRFDGGFAMSRRTLVSLSACWLVVALLAILLSRSPPPPDALAPYDSIQPGASRAVLRSYSCAYLYVPAAGNFCELHSEGIVRAVYVTHDGARITNVSFSLRGMQQAMLETRYGRAIRRLDGARHWYRLCYANGVQAWVYARPWGVLAPSTFVTVSESSICSRSE